MNTISVLEYQSSATAYGSLKTWKNIKMHIYIQWLLSKAKKHSRYRPELA
jgi:hypothetical protein